MKKFLSMLTAVAMSAVMLSGCSGSSESSTGGADTDSTAMETPVDIGIIQLTEHPALDASREGFIAALAESGLVESNEVPNCNVSGTSDLTPVKEQIDLLTKLIPDAKKITIMYCSGEQNSLIQADLAEEAAKAVGLEVERKTVTSTNDVAQVAESVIGTCDAIYVPTDNVLASSMPLVTSITNPAGLPVIVGETGMVNGGGLASVAIDYTDLGKLTGKMAAQIIEGSDVKTMPVQYAENPELVINETAADELGITIPDDIKSNATLTTTTSK